MKNTNTLQSKEQRLNDIQKMIGWITHSDQHATINKIMDQLESKHGINTNTTEVNEIIERMTSDHQKSFVVMSDVKRGHAEHMDRFMLLDTGHRKIKSCELDVCNEFGARYIVEFWLPNGGVFNCWIGIITELKYIVLGVKKVIYEKRTFEDLQNRGELQAGTISWLLSEFPNDGQGMKMAAEMINDFVLTIPFPSAGQLNVFNGFESMAFTNGGGHFRGKIQSLHENDRDAGVNGILFHPISSFVSIKIFVQY